MIRARRVVRAPPSELYAFLRDLGRHWQLTDGAVVPVGHDDGGAEVVIRGPLGLRRSALTRIDIATPGELSGTAFVGATTRATVSWHLEPAPGGTSVELGVRVDRASWRDGLVLALGGRAWLRGRLQRALRRLDELAPALSDRTSRTRPHPGRRRRRAAR
jgi:hypothetical protein